MKTELKNLRINKKAGTAKGKKAGRPSPHEGRTECVKVIYSRE